MLKWLDCLSHFHQILIVYPPGYEKKITSWTRLLRKLFQSSSLSRLLLCFLILISCSDPPPPVKSESFLDLSRYLRNSKYSGFHFDETKDLSYHWKKNSARFSNLSRDRRWQNTQITFLKNSDVLHNHSLDSIMMTPNSKLEFKILKGRGKLKFRYGALAKNGRDISGTLTLFTGTKLLSEISISSENKETWKDFKIDFEFTDDLTFEWKSSDSFLFLGTPEFTNIKNTTIGYNVLLIVVDSLRKDALGCNGQKLAISPNIDKLCKEGITFNNHFSNANWTKPSMISMLTGEYASNLGITNTGFPIYPREKEVFYNQSIKGLPEILRNHGYYTASIMNNVFLLDYTGVGVDLGFHELHQIGKDIVDTEVITKESLSFLKNLPERPFFLHINYNTPHGSYSPPEHSLWEIKNESNPKDIASINPIIYRYFGEVRYTDEQIGKVIKALKDKEIYDNTMIIITSDHGDLFDERHTFNENGIYGTRFGHGETHYDEEISIPLIIKIPKTIKNTIEKKIFYTPSSSVSLVPTILGFLGFKEDIHKNIRGFDYSSHILDNAEPLSETPIFTEGRLSESIRTSKYKYIRRYPGFTNYLLQGAVLPSEKLEELYDLKKDPLEHLNIKKINPVLYKEALIEKKNFKLRKNTFFLSLQKGHSYDGNFNFQGGIYDFDSTNCVTLKTGNRTNISFFGTPDRLCIINIQVNDPELKYDFSIRRDGLQSTYRVGAWGLINRDNLGKDPDVIHSSKEPDHFQNSDLPFLYSDELLSGKINKGETGVMAEEVKSILKSWGYIHE